MPKSLQGAHGRRAFYSEWKLAEYNSGWLRCRRFQINVEGTDKDLIVFHPDTDMQALSALPGVEAASEEMCTFQFCNQTRSLCPCINFETNATNALRSSCKFHLIAKARKPKPGSTAAPAGGKSARTCKACSPSNSSETVPVLSPALVSTAHSVSLQPSPDRDLKLATSNEGFEMYNLDNAPYAVETTRLLEKGAPRVDHSSLTGGAICSEPLMQIMMEMDMYHPDDVGTAENDAGDAVQHSSSLSALSTEDAQCDEKVKKRKVGDRDVSAVTEQVDPMEGLAHAAEMYKSGLITVDEFAQQKKIVFMKQQLQIIETMSSSGLLSSAELEVSSSEYLTCPKRDRCPCSPC